jgi:hypothetical protein
LSCRRGGLGIEKEKEGEKSIWKWIKFYNTTQKEEKDGINMEIFIVKYFFKTCITTTQGKSWKTSTLVRPS